MNGVKVVIEPIQLLKILMKCDNVKRIETVSGVLWQV